jgi:hypothetical protein
MGNCSGLLSACAGEDENAVRKINQENLQMALAKNRDLDKQGQFMMQDQFSSANNYRGASMN